MNAKIVKGPFAKVTSGNATESWMLDGDDIQDRADAAMDRHFASSAHVIERGQAGYGIQVEGSPYIAAVYLTEEAALAALNRRD